MGKVEYSITSKSIRIVIFAFTTLFLICIYLYLNHAIPTSGASCSTIGKTNIRKGDKGYSTSLDRDGDGIACESN